MGDGGYSYILYISLMCLQVLQPPAGYVPIRTPARKLIATPTPMVGAAGTPTGFRMQTPDSKTAMVDMQPKGNLPMMKPDDMQYFDKLLVSAHCLLLVNDC